MAHTGERSPSFSQLVKDSPEEFIEQVRTNDEAMLFLSKNWEKQAKRLLPFGVLEVLIDRLAISKVPADIDRLYDFSIFLLPFQCLARYTSLFSEDERYPKRYQKLLRQAWPAIFLWSHHMLCPSWNGTFKSMVFRVGYADVLDTWLTFFSAVDDMMAIFSKTSGAVECLARVWIRAIVTRREDHIFSSSAVFAYYSKLNDVILRFYETAGTAPSIAQAVVDVLPTLSEFPDDLDALLSSVFNIAVSDSGTGLLQSLVQKRIVPLTVSILRKFNREFPQLSEDGRSKRARPVGDIVYALGSWLSDVDSNVWIVRFLHQGFLKDVLQCIQYARYLQVANNRPDIRESLHYLLITVVGCNLSRPRVHRALSAALSDIKGTPLEAKFIMLARSSPCLKGWRELKQLHSDLCDSDKGPVFRQVLLGHDTCFKCRTHGTKMKGCTVCRGPLYCSRKCQKEDWPVHKHFCSGTLLEKDS
ncbi:hypothetical protein DL96DRAFT_233784 [Flagelloscypha sp. PMI_526]|nr:hypothetical protein DL96DRAFT_233784 [Flagelloscypha sp. PMI_526]